MEKPIAVRDYSLDALRGLAIAGMIWSGNLHKELPGWMFHAQVPPPQFKFNPLIPGITWVDLVFPFFIFAMGAAIPLALTKRLSTQTPLWKIGTDTLLRFLMLAWFAIFFQHIKPWAINPAPDTQVWLISLLGFLLMFAMYIRLPEKYAKWYTVVLRIIGYGGAILLLYLLKYPDGEGFKLTRSDIIILVLANLVIPGTLIWYFTRNNYLLRFGILAFYLAFRLTADVEGSWNQLVWNATPAGWLYKLYYWQYLFILIPGTIAGDLILQYTKNQTNNVTKKVHNYQVPIIFITLIAIIIVNLICLYQRFLLINLLFAIVSYMALMFITRNEQDSRLLFYRNIIQWGTILLLMGLTWEAFEGGIKKDKSTISYYMVTSGLAFYTVLLFTIFIGYFKLFKRTRLLVYAGQNPMIAYVAAALVVHPLLNLSHLNSVLAILDTNPWLGALKGLLITIFVLIIATYFTHKKLFWRT